MIDESIKIEVEADLETVFNLFSDAEIIESWSEDIAVFDSYVGGKISLFSGWIKGVIKEYVKYSKIVFTWEDANWLDCVSTVEIIFEPRENSVAVFITQKNFPDVTSVEEQYDFWYDNIINPSMSYLHKEQNYGCY